MKTVDRVWFLSHCEWIYNNRQRLKEKPCANFVLTGFVINSFGCPYYGYAIDKITLGNLIKLWDNGFVYIDFPLIHYRISHGDSSTHIAYIYHGKVFSHRFSRSSSALSSVIFPVYSDRRSEETSSQIAKINTMIFACINTCKNVFFYLNNGYII